jgi:hypothetical protein
VGEPSGNLLGKNILGTFWEHSLGGDGKTHARCLYILFTRFLLPPRDACHMDVFILFIQGLYSPHQKQELRDYSNLNGDHTTKNPQKM